MQAVPAPGVSGHGSRHQFLCPQDLESFRCGLQPDMAAKPGEGLGAVQDPEAGRPTEDEPLEAGKAAAGLGSEALVPWWKRSRAFPAVTCSSCFGSWCVTYSYKTRDGVLWNKVADHELVPCV